MIAGLFHAPPGVDFSAVLARGLRARLADAPPEAMARVTVLVNTSRMARRLEAALAAEGPTLLPRIGLVSDLALLLPPGRAPVADISPLALRLRLAELVRSLLEQRPDLSPPVAAFDLAGSLLTLLEEMREEGLSPEALDAVDVGALSKHWQDNLTFLRIATAWLAEDAALTPAGAQAHALDMVLTHWRDAPPQDPVIIAGSTASRAPTRALIRAVLDLPQGAVVLPGLDAEMPAAAWAALAGDGPGEMQDHPQYRHAALLRALGHGRKDVAAWADAAPASTARNRLISLALRPAPATDAWRLEGPDLEAEVAAACEGITLLDAPGPGAEAAAIAVGLRGALAEGRRAAVITPDRTLSRQVAAHLDRWGITPDDSAGRPLSQSEAGRLMLHLAEMRAAPLEAEALAILLKHPLTCAGGDRAAHLTQARRVETEWLRAGPVPFPTQAGLADWTGSQQLEANWRAWLSGLLAKLEQVQPAVPLATHVANLRSILDVVAQGMDALWDSPAGRAAAQVLDGLARDAGAAGDRPMSAGDFARLLRDLLAAEEVRDPYTPHPDVMIWGALEARVRHADLVILGGLNDEVWPGQPTPDPWLNRTMRVACGLRLPDRSIGLSAHDFQQAAAGPEIWLSRSVRDAETDKVASRWVNRLTGLLGGMGPEGAQALRDMRARGGHWSALAAALDRPDGRHPSMPAPRPAPALPRGEGIEQLSVTAVEMLIRDPYAIYARRFLGLMPMPPLRQGPNARVRGQALHDAMDRFARQVPGPLPEDAEEQLDAALNAALADHAPWPGSQRLWLGKFARARDDLLTAERARRAKGRPTIIEDYGRLTFADPPFTLIAKADRIDDRGEAVAIYDYKTGEAPSPKQQKQFAKQLIFEALMVTEGAFPKLGPRKVEDVAYLSIGSRYKETAPDTFGPELIAETRRQLLDLIRRYRDGQPFIARLAPETLQYAGDYDQLARYGEWDDTVQATRIPVGRT